jgi:hypothetical protein
MIKKENTCPSRLFLKYENEIRFIQTPITINWTEIKILSTEFLLIITPTVPRMKTADANIK